MKRAPEISASSDLYPLLHPRFAFGTPPFSLVPARVLAQQQVAEHHAVVVEQHHAVDSSLSMPSWLHRGYMAQMKAPVSRLFAIN